MTSDFFIIALASVLGGVMLTGLVRLYALRASLLDVPNQRSSHEAATPRGGGIAVAATFLTGATLLFVSGSLEPRLYWGLLGSGLLVTGVGFADDHRHVAARWRLLVHFIAAFWLVYLLLPGSHWIVACGLVVGLVWLLNLYNFMDGIDGIASIEAITVCIGGYALAHFTGAVTPDSNVLILLLGASLGFLFWNFPKARIFLGDAGSGFLGIVIGAFVVAAGTVSFELFIGWAILLGCFVVDATVTLARRVLRGQRFYEAHRGHAYQVASRRYGDHRPVTIAVAAINLCWLLPVAIAVVTKNVTPWGALPVAWLPLIVLAFHFEAGLHDQ